VKKNHLADWRRQSKDYKGLQRLSLDRQETGKEFSEILEMTHRNSKERKTTVKNHNLQKYSVSDFRLWSLVGVEE
jgi:mRNA-degrading endonuclease RelE of RelBE toxin-antitoxin system